MLAGIGDVDDPPGAKLIHPVADCGDVGDVIAVAASGVPDDRRCVEPLGEDNQSTVVYLRDPAPLKVVGQRSKQRIVAGLPGHIGVGQLDVHPGVGAVEPSQRDLDQALPRLAGGRVAGLQLDHTFARARRERLVSVQMSVGPSVQLLCTGQVEGGQIQPLIGDLLDQHAELASPVADVVLCDHLVAERAQHPVEAVTDDRRAQVADVHLLGHVGRRVVDDHALGISHRHDARPRIGELVGYGRSQYVGPDPEVDEARPGHLGGFAQVVQL